MTSLTLENKIQKLHKEFSDCTRCPLHLTRNQLVFGEGNPKNKILLIGEGPGKEEDSSGRPFVGKSGKLLTTAIESIFNDTRINSVYITNIVKCRPTLVNKVVNKVANTIANDVENKTVKDRPPTPEEVEKCMPILLAQIDLLAPDVIISLGSSALNALISANAGNNKKNKTKVSITKMRGKQTEFSGITLVPTFHPSYVLRNGGHSSAMWKVFLDDLKFAVSLA